MPLTVGGVLLSLVAAHPAARPELLAALAVHVRTAGVPDPRLAHALLSNPDLSVEAIDDVATGVARTVTGVDPTLRVADGATLSQVLRSVPGPLSAGQWTFLLRCVPYVDVDLAAAALQAPTHPVGPVPVSEADQRATVLTLAANSALPAELRAAALVRAVRTGPLTARDAPLRTVADLARAGHSMPAHLARTSDAQVTTLLQAALTPYPHVEPAETAGRLRALNTARGDATLTARCVLLRCGPRAVDVALLVLDDPATGRALLTAVAATPNVPRTVRHVAALRALAASAPPDVTLLRALEELAPDPRTDLVALGALIDAGRLEATRRRVDRTTAQLDATLDHLEHLERGKSAPSRRRSAFPVFELVPPWLTPLCGDLTTLAAATAEHRARVRALLAARGGTDSAATRWVGVAAVADAVAAGTSTWGALPVASAAEVTAATPGLAGAFDEALAVALPLVTADVLRALLVVLDGFSGTVEELFDLAQTIAM